jgi:hypothetical protein
MTNSNGSQHQHTASARASAAPVPAIGATRSFWQRWKEWERENETVLAVHEQTA